MQAFHALLHNLLLTDNGTVSVHLRSDDDGSFLPDPLDIHIHVPKQRQINIRLPEVNAAWEDSKSPNIIEKPAANSGHPKVATAYPEVATAAEDDKMTKKSEAVTESPAVATAYPEVATAACEYNTTQTPRKTEPCR